MYEVTCNIINGIYSDFLHVSSSQVCKTSRIRLWCLLLLEFIIMVIMASRNSISFPFWALSSFAYSCERFRSLYVTLCMWMLFVGIHGSLQPPSQSATPNIHLLLFALLCMSIFGYNCVEFKETMRYYSSRPVSLGDGKVLIYFIKARNLQQFW